MAFHSISAAIIIGNMTTIVGLGFGKHHFFPSLLAIASQAIFALSLELSTSNYERVAYGSTWMQ
jgi:hypothetical protein